MAFIKLSALFLSTLIPTSCGSVVDVTHTKHVHGNVTTMRTGRLGPVVKFLSTEGEPISQRLPPEFAAIAAEFTAMFLFMIICCGITMHISKTKHFAYYHLYVSLVYAFAFAALSHAIGHYSGGQLSPAITVGLMFTGRTTIAQGILDIVGQVLGAILASIFLLIITHRDKDMTRNLCMNVIESGWNPINVLLAEATMSFMLVFVFLETQTNPNSVNNAALAPASVGAVMFVAHSALLPIDGCSVNPARSIAPTLVVKLNKYLNCYDKERFDEVESPFAGQWIFWVGPLMGSLVAAGFSAALMS